MKVLSLEPSDRSKGQLHLSAEGWGGVADGGGVETFVEQMLKKHSDVPAKLSRHAADERHAFIWTTIGSDYSVQFAIENREGARLPQSQPYLPDGVTHVWVGGSFSSQGVVGQFPDRGWWKTPFMWPVDG